MTIGDPTRCSGRVPLVRMMGEQRGASEHGVAVVTGAASGIGAATARRLARDGFRVWLTDIAADRAAEVAAEICAGGGDALSVPIDVGEASSVEEAFAVIMQREKSLDVLVNSAGVVVVCPFEAIPPELWQQAYRVNVVGTYLCMQAALPALLAAPPPARVINLASAAGKLPGIYTAPYNATKAAVISLTRTAAAAWAPQVLVNCVCPGVIDTPMWEEIDARLAAIDAPPTTRFSERAVALPARRAGTADEVASVIAFLASQDSAYLTGEDVNVSGGLVMH